MITEIPGCATCFACLSHQREETVLVSSMTCSSCGKYHHPECWAQSQQCAYCSHRQAEQQEVLVPALDVPKRIRIPIKIKSLPVFYVLNKDAFTKEELVKFITYKIYQLVGILVLLGLGLFIGYYIINNPIEPEIPTPVTGNLPTSTLIRTPTLLPAPTMVPLGTARIQKTEVNLRSGPGLHNTSLGTLMRGSVVEVIGGSEIIDGNLWVRIQANGRTGWVNQNYLLIGQPVSGERARVKGVRPDTLRLRSAPSTDASVIDRLNEGTEVDLLGETSRVNNITWQRVRIDNKNGWVDGRYLERIP